MIEFVLLDSGPLGLISHPRPATDILVWSAELIGAGIRIVIPEIADYEIRRELLRARKTKGLKRLDELKGSLEFAPITSEAMLLAAEFWANARRKGRPTSGGDSLDADVILAGQAATFATRSVVVATSNLKHLSRFVNAKIWHEITP
jgi:predicted nucleic acid-binding protein